MTGAPAGGRRSRSAARKGQTKKKGTRPGKPAQRGAPERRSDQPRKRTWLLYMFALLSVAAGSGLLLWMKSLGSDAPLTVSTLPDPDSIDPQIRKYVLDHVEWVQDAPNDAHRQATLGLVYVANGFLPQALASFQNAVRLSPDEPHAHLHVAISIMEMERTDEGIELFRQLTARFPDFAPVYYHLGDALLRKGAIDEAESAFNNLIALAPDQWRGYAGLGTVNHRKGEFAEAARQLEKAIQLDPKAKIAHHQLGLAYRRLGRMDEAQSELNLGLNAKKYPIHDEWSVTIPHHQKGLNDQFGMARTYRSRGEPERSVEILEEALAWHPDNVDVMGNLGLAYYDAGRAQEARDILRKVTRIDPSNFRAYVNLAVSCLRLGLTEEALDCADRATELAPFMAQTHVVKAHVLRAMKRDLEALAALEAAIRCDPQNFPIRMRAGDLCMSLKRPADAKQHYMNATRKRAGTGRGFLGLAEAHMQLGEFPEAATALEAARELAPREPKLAALEKRLSLLTDPTDR